MQDSKKKLLLRSMCALSLEEYICSCTSLHEMYSVHRHISCLFFAPIVLFYSPIPFSEEWYMAISTPLERIHYGIPVSMLNNHVKRKENRSKSESNDQVVLWQLPR